MELTYLAGCDRSGTTVISSYLAQVGGVTAVGEVRNIWARGFAHNERCSCGDAFADCVFWGPLREQLPISRSRAMAIDAALGNLVRTRYLKGILKGNGPRSRWVEMEDLAKTIRPVYEEIDRRTANVVVDSSKSPAYAAFLHRFLGIQLHVTQVVRHPCAVVNSLGSVRRRMEAAEPSLMNRHGTVLSSLMWLNADHASSRLRAEIPGTVIRYEDVCRDPGPLSANIVNDVAAVSAAGQDHQVSGNPSRVGRGRVTLEMDDRWRTTMSPLRQRIAWAITGPAGRAHGYGRPHAS